MSIPRFVQRACSASFRCLSVFALVGLLIGAFATAYAQVTVGPPDDPYEFEDASKANGAGYPTFYKSADGLPTLVDTTRISSIDPSKFPDICTFVEVLDSLGNPIGGFDEDSFCVYQDSIRIDSFSVVEQQDSCISSICLVIDISGSMNSESKIDSAKSAANQFIDQMDVLDRMAIVSFSSCYDVVIDFTSDQAALHNAVNSLSASGFTAAFDGIWGGVNLTVDELGGERSLAVIALSDGMENRSWACSTTTVSPDGITFDGFQDDSTLIVSLANANGIPIYAISLGSGFDPQYLMALSAGSGGAYYHAPTGAEIVDVYEEIKTRLCSRYLICYTSPDTLLNGDCHTVQICHSAIVDKHHGGGGGDPTPPECIQCDTTVYCEPVPPRIRLVTDTACSKPGDDIILCATVVDSDTPPESLTVRLFYRTDFGGSYTQVNLTSSDSLYCDTLDGSLFPCGSDGVQFFFVASDGTSTVSSPPNNPETSPHLIAVCPNNPPSCTTLVSPGPPTCLPAEAHVVPIITTDDDPGDSIYCVLYGDGVLDGSTWRVDNPQPGQTVSAHVVCYDMCGDSCWVDFNFTFPTPVDIFCNIPDDTVITICFPGPDSIPVSATGGAICKVISGPGVVQNGYWVYTPGQNDTLVQSVTIECATDCDTCRGTFRVEVNQPPMVICGGDLRFPCDSVGDFDFPVLIDELPADSIDLQTRIDTIPGNCPNSYQLIKTWIVTDNCGLVDSCSQLMTVYDNEKPTIECPDTVYVDCPVPDSIDLGMATAKDNCDTLPKIHRFLSAADLVGTCQEIRIYGYWAEDACGNVSDTCFQFMFVQDTTPPVIACPDTGFFPCGTAIFIQPPSATDECDDSVAVELLQVVNDTDVACPNTRVTTYYWEATDDCGNSATCAWTTVFIDTIPPTIECPDPDTVQWNPNSIIVFTPPPAEDFCDTLVDVRSIGDTTITDGVECPVIAVRVKMWEAVDDCGNADTCRQLVYIIDTLPPVIECETSAFYACDEVPAEWPAPSATDDCDSTVDVTLVRADTTPTDCEQRYSVFLEWKAEDDCGNMSLCPQQVIVADTAKPTITCPDTVHVECGIVDSLLDLGTATAIDNCDTLPDISRFLAASDLVGTCNEIRIYGWYAVDDCGNYSDTCYQYVIAYDTTAPVCDSLPDTLRFVICQPGDEICIPFGATDNCDTLVDCTATIGGDVVDGRWCYNPTFAGSFELVFRCVDDCGNTCFDTVQVVVDIDSPPQCEPHEDVTIFFCDSTDCDTLFAYYDEVDSTFQNCGYYMTGSLDNKLVPETFDSLPIQICASAFDGDTTLYVVWVCYDTCGTDCRDTFAVKIDFNEPPTCYVAPGLDTLKYFGCDSVQVCLDWSAQDLDRNIDTCWTNFGPVTPDTTKSANGLVACSDYFFNDTTVEFILTCIDSCGEVCAETVTVVIDINEPPICEAPPDTTLFWCPGDSGLACFGGFKFSDPDGNLFDWGFDVNGSTKAPVIDSVIGTACLIKEFWNFDADTTLEVVFWAVDVCGDSCADTMYLGIDVNEPPTCTLPNDTTLFFCEGDTCITWSGWWHDPDGNMADYDISLLPLDKGTTFPDSVFWYITACPTDVDTTFHVYSWTIDSCGAECYDTVTINIRNNHPPRCYLEADTVWHKLCGPDTVCFLWNSNDIDGNLDTCTFRVIDGQNKTPLIPECFYVDTDTIITVEMTCVDSCGETCVDTVVIVAEVNEMVTCDLNDTTLFFCDSLDLQCVDVFSNDPDYWTGFLTQAGVVDTTGVKDFPFDSDSISHNGQLCFYGWMFPNDTTIHVYVHNIDDCGSECFDTAAVEIRHNRPPVCEGPNDTTLFFCEGDSCHTFYWKFYDPDGNFVTWDGAIIPGEDKGAGYSGTDTAMGMLEICLDEYPRDTTIRVVTYAGDSCDAVCYDTVTITIGVNEPPICRIPTEDTLRFFSCDSAYVCVPWYGYDLDNNLDSCWTSFGPVTPDSVASDSAKDPDGDLTCQYFYNDTTLEFVLTCVDSCGEVCSDTVIIIVDVNQPPVCIVPNDTTLVFCGPNDVNCLLWEYSDADGNVFPAGQVEFGPCGDTIDPDKASVEVLPDSGSIKVCWLECPQDTTIPWCLTVTDSCGAVCSDTTWITFDCSEEPICDLGNDTTLFFCDQDGCDSLYYTVEDADGDQMACVLRLIGDPAKSVDTGMFHICPPPNDTTWTIELTCIDSCGNLCYDTISVGLVHNKPPRCDVPDDLVYFACEPGDTLLLPVTSLDIDGNLDTCAILSGPGEWAWGSWWYVADSTEDFCVVFWCQDSCGATCIDSFCVSITINSPPVCESPNDTTLVFCGDNTVHCLNWRVSDVDGNLFYDGVDSWFYGFCDAFGGDSVIDKGIVDARPDSGWLTVCWPVCPFDTDTTIAYCQYAIDSCGAECLDTTWITFVCNKEPICDLGHDTTLSFCYPEECDTLPYYYGDEDSDYFDCILTSLDPKKDVDTGQLIICNTGVDTIYYFELRCYDSCGGVCYDTLRIQVDANLPPVCMLPSDTTIFLCDSSDTVMLPIDSYDPDGDLEECRVIGGPGSIDNGIWTYIPFDDAKNCNTCGDDGRGPVCVLVECIDECGAACVDSFCVNIWVNQPPIVKAPKDTTVYLCRPDTICLGPWPEIDLDGNKLQTFIHYGWMVPPFVCFEADTPGTYIIDCCVEDSCGAITCDTAIVIVEMNTPPVCDMPGDTAIGLCEPGTVRIAIGATDVDTNLVGCTVNEGPGKIVGDEWIYEADHDTSFCVVFWCFDECETFCADTFCVTIDINDPPLCDLPDDTSFFQCLPEEVCIPFIYFDDPPLGGGTVDHVTRTTGSKSNPTPHMNRTVSGSPFNKAAIFDTCIIVSGPGELRGNSWCYTPPAGDTTFTVIIHCFDTCGAVCGDTFKVDFHVNRKPMCHIPNDTTIIVCGTGTICLPYSGSDPDGNLWLCRVVGSKGPVGEFDNLWCYSPTIDETVEVIIQCVDSCSQTCFDTFNVTFAINGPPTCAWLDLGPPPPCPSPTAPFFQPFTVADTSDGNDTDNDSLVCELLPGAKGSLNNGGSPWSIDPIPGDTISDTIVCHDPCGAACTLLVEFILPNPAPPICQIPEGGFRFVCDTITPDSLPLYAIGADSCVLHPGSPGEIRNGYWVYTPKANGTILVEVTCYGPCDECSGEFEVTYQINEPPMCYVPDTLRTKFLCEPDTICFGGFEFYDEDENGDSCYVVNGRGHFIFDIPPSSPDDVGKGYFVGWCYYAEDDDTFDVIVECVDTCGATCRDTFTVIIEMNDPPVCAHRNDTTIFTCGVPQSSICFPIYQIGTTDEDNNLQYCYPLGLGKSEEFCVRADIDSTYEIIIRCEDECGAYCEDTFYVTIDVNEAPECVLPNDTTIFLCEPTEICLPISGTDVDSNFWGCLVTEECKTPGGCVAKGESPEEPVSEWCYYAEKNETVVVSVICYDSCEASCRSSFIVTFILNEPPTCEITGGGAPPECIQGLHLVTFKTTDSTALPLTCTHTNQGATLGDGTWSYLPLPGEHVVDTIICMDTCGAACSLYIDITFPDPQPPVCVVPNDTTIVFCGEEEICLGPISSGQNCSVSVGDVEEGTWCYTTQGIDEVLNVVLTCTGECETVCKDSFTVTLESDSPPEFHFGGDTVVFQCNEKETICVPYSLTNSEGDVTLTKLSGPGTIDENNSRICFTPGNEGVYTIIVEATDNCGGSTDTINVTVIWNSLPVCNVPKDTVHYVQCETEELCVPVSADDPDGNLQSCVKTSGPGTVSNGQWCWTPPNADTVVTVGVRCTDSCGEFCNANFIVAVEANTAPVCLLPSDTAYFLCDTTEICRPVGAFDIDSNGVTCEVVSGKGAIENGFWCYTATVDEVVVVTVRCEDECGAFCQSSFTVTIDMNEPPICQVPPDQSIVICEGDELCLPISASDPDDNWAVCELVDGLGEVANGYWCFTPVNPGFVPVTIRCIDDCGASCEETHEYRIVFDAETCIPGVANILPWPGDQLKSTNTGDVNGDGKVDIVDMASLTAMIYRPSENTGVLKASVSNGTLRGDINCDGKIDAGDVVALATYMFRGGDSPCEVSSASTTPSADDQNKSSTATGTLPGAQSTGAVIEKK